MKYEISLGYSTQKRSKTYNYSIQHNSQMYNRKIPVLPRFQRATYLAQYDKSKRKYNDKNARKEKTQKARTPTTSTDIPEVLPRPPSAQQTHDVAQEVSQPQTPTKQTTNTTDQMAYQAQHFLLYDPTRSRSNSPEPQRRRQSRSTTPEPERSTPKTPTKQRQQSQLDHEPMTPVKVKHIKSRDRHSKQCAAPAKFCLNYTSTQETKNDTRNSTTLGHDY